MKLDLVKELWILPILTIDPEFFSSSFSKFLLKRIGAIIFVQRWLQSFKTNLLNFLKFE